MKEFYEPRAENKEENEPALPSEPTEAALWLQELWERGGGWKGQHPIELKVKSSEDYQSLTEEEREEWHKIQSEFMWLAEMYRSEMCWSQSYTRTNYGEVIGFYFGYEIPENPADNIPEAYIFRPFNEEQSATFLSKGREGGWQIQPLQDVAASYAKNFDY